MIETLCSARWHKVKWFFPTLGIEKSSNLQNNPYQMTLLTPKQGHLRGECVVFEFSRLKNKSTRSSEFSCYAIERNASTQPFPPPI